MSRMQIHAFITPGACDITQLSPTQSGCPLVQLQSKP